ncbi:hypothetical protein, partial [Streptomyces sp. NPDC097981]|uniref:hypothetical protein n=1 Tax=Streptomyces sp. NPDC097981 TaxID=3155428 RepID=UPI003316F79D
FAGAVNAERPEQQSQEHAEHREEDIVAARGRRWSWRPGGRVVFLVLVMAVVPEKSGPGGTGR